MSISGTLPWSLSLSLSHILITHTHTPCIMLCHKQSMCTALSLSLSPSLHVHSYLQFHHNLRLLLLMDTNSLSLSLSLSMSTAIFIIPHVMGCTYKLLDAFFVVTYIGLWKNCKVNPKSKSFHCSPWKYPRVWCSNPLQLRLVSKLFWLTLNEKVSHVQ